MEEAHAQARTPYPADRIKQYEAAISNRSASHNKKNGSTAGRGIPAAPNSPAGKSTLNPAMSFVMLNESQLQPGPVSSRLSDHHHPAKSPNPHDGEAFAHMVDSNTKMFEILSSRSDVDHPICSECTDLLLSQFESRLQAAGKERDAYIAFLKDLKNNIPTDAEVMKANSDLAMAKQAEQEAFASLLDLQKEKEALEEALEEVEAESRGLDADEEKFWRSRNQFDTKVIALANTRDALETSYNHDLDQLEKLQRTNIYNDLFCIGHDGHFGTINGLRLGKLSPPNNVEWPEINAAWGATAHLLLTVADRLGYTFRGYILRPMGSTTRIDKIDQASTSSTTASTLTTTSRGSNQAQDRIVCLELFSSGDLPLARSILHRKINEAMVAFLECVKQLGEHVERNSGLKDRYGETRKLPYTIERDKINRVSIKLGTSQDEAWTAACKYTLTCCKFLLAYASNIATTTTSAATTTDATTRGDR